MITTFGFAFLSVNEPLKKLKSMLEEKKYKSLPQHKTFQVK